MLYIGLDVHLKSSAVCVIDEHGKRVQQKAIRGPWPVVVDWLKELGAPISVCYEAPCGYGPLYEVLSIIASSVDVAHPVGCKNSSDLENGDSAHCMGSTDTLRQ